MCNIEKQKDQVREAVAIVAPAPTVKKEEIKVEVKQEPIKVEPVVEKIIEEPVKAVEKVVEEAKEETKQETKEEPAKVKVNLPKPVIKNVEVKEEHVLNFMVQSTKEDKSFVTGRWNLIRKYIQQPTFKKAASLLIDGGPIACGPTGIIISFDLKARAEAVMAYENYFAIKDFLKELLGEEYYFIAISENDFKTHKLHYINLMGQKTLPAPQEFTDFYEKVEEVEIEEVVEETDPILEMGKNIFGDLLKVEE